MVAFIAPFPSPHITRQGSASFQRRRSPRFSTPLSNGLRPFSMSAATTPPGTGRLSREPRPRPATPPPLLPKHVIWRWRVFLTMLVSYAVYYVTRFSFPFSAPVMQSSIGLSLEQVGLISSCFPAVYGVSKLLGGVVADLGSPRAILALGLALAAACNILFAAGNTVPYFALVWALNGAVSSVGFPACAKLLSTWFSQEERGTYWGILNVSLNVGGALSPIIVGMAAATWGWRFGMLIPAALALAMAAISYVAVADSPAKAGLSAHPSLPAEKPAEKTGRGNGQTTDGKKRGPVQIFKQQLVEGVLTERAVWSLAGAYFFVYVIRQALTSWTIFYLMQARGVATLVEAGVRVSGLELGGLLGSVSSGWLSDKLVGKFPEKGVVGQRVRVIMLYLGVMACAITGFFYIPVTKALLPAQWLLFAVAGFGLYGPQLLVGLSGTECVDRKFAGTSNGFVGLLAYAGAALAGLPLSLCVRRLGWNSFFAVVLGCCGIVALLLAPLLRKKSFEQVEAERTHVSATGATSIAA